MFTPLLKTLAPLALLLIAVPFAAGQDEAQEPLRLDVRAPLPDAETIAELPPDGGPEFNRLIFSKSPYLLQHARDPVQWWPWCQEAFDKAAELDMPVYVSVGYATCHWCHVMERESFGDDVIAEGLNSQFICIKVDREERPDIDAVLMKYCQFFGKRAGWPLNCFLTPQKEPFWINSFIPRDGTLSKMGMVQLLPYITRGWRGQRGSIHRRSQDVMLAVAESMAKAKIDLPAEAAVKMAYTDLVDRYDEAEGGWGMRDFTDKEKLWVHPKFPVPHNIRFLLRYHARTGDPQALNMAETTLKRMARGGMRDLLSGGFHRYATDQFWRHPHWEKLLRDQAGMALAYIEGYQVTGEPLFRDVARETLDYVLANLTHQNGAFMSAEDAENTEDANSGQDFSSFYTWQEVEIMLALEAENDVVFATAVFGITEDGNFFDERTKTKTGRNLISMVAPREILAPQMYAQFDTLDRQLEAFDGQYQRVTDALRAARAMRVHPIRDQKILTDVNATMISALAMAGRTFEEQRYTDAAIRAMRYLDQNLRMTPEPGDKTPQRFVHSMSDGVADTIGFASDHTNMVIAQLELYRTTSDVEWLQMASETAELTLDHFWDFADGGVFTTANDAELLYVRPRDEEDTSTASANSVFLEGLTRLSRLTGNRDYAKKALEIYEFQSGRMKAASSWRCHLMLGLEHLLGTHYELVVTGHEKSEDAREALRTIRSGFFPTMTLTLRPPGEEIGALGVLAPHLIPLEALEGRTTFYLCVNQSCDAPTTDFEVIEKALGIDDE
tara:strand:+ start:37155 stop:39503 length:2349 start_codon:yes stop_codon:yes gene_type:complete